METSTTKNILEINRFSQETVVGFLKQMPSLSSSTTEIFRELGADFQQVGQIKQNLNAIQPLAKSLDNLSEKMKAENDHETKNVILFKLGCLLRAAIVPAMIAGVILFALPALVAIEAVGSLVGLFIFTLAGAITMGFYNFDHMGIPISEIPGGDMAGFVALIAGPFVPLCEIFKKTPHLEVSPQKTSKDPLEETCKKDIKFLNALICNNFDHLNKLLLNKLEDIEVSKKEFKKLPVQPSMVTDSYDRMSRELTIARQEMAVLNTYFKTHLRSFE